MLFSPKIYLTKFELLQDAYLNASSDTLMKVNDEYKEVFGYYNDEVIFCQEEEDEVGTWTTAEID